MSDDEISWIQAAAKEFDAIVVLIATAGGTQAYLLPRALLR